jgi:hypothetical protein
MLAKYPLRVERSMQHVFQSLGERERRLYAAIEAKKLGHGGIGYIAQLFQCDRKTVRRGLGELEQPSPLPPGRSRKKGAAGRPA